MKSLKPLLVILLILPLVLSTTLVFASSVMWSQTYGGEGEEVAHSLVETSVVSNDNARTCVLPNNFTRSFF